MCYKGSWVELSDKSSVANYTINIVDDAGYGVIIGTEVSTATGILDLSQIIKY
jgi:hypothetical protein